MDENTNNKGETIGIKSVFKEFPQEEWCFQFDDDEPFVFSWSLKNSHPGELTFQIKPQEGSSICFSAPSGKKFKLFSREMSETTRKTRDQNEKN